MKRLLSKKQNRLIIIMLFWFILLLSLRFEWKTLETLKYQYSTGEAEIVEGEFRIADEYKDKIHYKNDFGERRYLITEGYVFYDITTNNLGTELEIKDISYKGDALVVILKDINPATMGGCAITEQYLKIELRKPVEHVQVDIDYGNQYRKRYSIMDITKLFYRYKSIIIIFIISVLITTLIAIFIKNTEKQNNIQNHVTVKEGTYMIKGILSPEEEEKYYDLPDYGKQSPYYHKYTIIDDTVIYNGINGDKVTDIKYKDNKVMITVKHEEISVTESSNKTVGMKAPKIEKTCHFIIKLDKSVEDAEFIYK